MKKYKLNFMDRVRIFLGMGCPCCGYKLRDEIGNGWDYIKCDRCGWKERVFS